MSVHDEGYGDNVRPTLEFESDFANRFRSVGAEGDQSWAADAHAAHRSEDSLMTSGPGRPGQPMPGQRSIFGTGRGPVFAQMPAYKPVTRGSEPQPQAPEPPQPDFGAYARQGVEPAAAYRAMRTRMAPRPTRPRAPRREATTTPDFPNPFPPQQTYQPQPQPPQSYQPQPQQSYQPQPQQSYQPQPRGRATSHSRRIPRPELPAAAIRPAEPSGSEPSEPNSGPAGIPARANPVTPLPGCGLPRPDLPGRGRATREPCRAGIHRHELCRCELMATHPSRMPASLTPPSQMQVSRRRRPSRITPPAPAHHDAFGAHELLHLDDAAAPYGTEADPESFADQSGHDYQAGHDYLSPAGHTPGVPASSAVASGPASLRCRLRAAAADRAWPHAISKPDAAAERASGFL